MAVNGGFGLQRFQLELQPHPTTAHTVLRLGHSPHYTPLLSYSPPTLHSSLQSPMSPHCRVHGSLVTTSHHRVTWHSKSSTPGFKLHPLTTGHPLLLGLCPGVYTIFIFTRTHNFLYLSLYPTNIYYILFSRFHSASRENRCLLTLACYCVLSGTDRFY